MWLDTAVSWQRTRKPRFAASTHTGAQFPILSTSTQDGFSDLPGTASSLNLAARCRPCALLWRSRGLLIGETPTFRRPAEWIFESGSTSAMSWLMDRISWAMASTLQRAWRALRTQAGSAFRALYVTRSRGSLGF